MLSLLDKTQTYWKISSQREGRIPCTIDVTTASHALNAVVEECGSQRKLYIAVVKLQCAIVEGPRRGRKPKNKQSAKVLQMPQAQVG